MLWIRNQVKAALDAISHSILTTRQQGVFFFFFWLCCAACGIFCSPTKNWTCAPRHWEHRVLTARLPGKSWGSYYWCFTGKEIWSLERRRCLPKVTQLINRWWSLRTKPSLLHPTFIKDPSSGSAIGVASRLYLLDIPGQLTPQILLNLSHAKESSLLLCIWRVTALLKLRSICVCCSRQVWNFSTPFIPCWVSAISYWVVSTVFLGSISTESQNSPWGRSSCPNPQKRDVRHQATPQLVNGRGQVWGKTVFCFLGLSAEGAVPLCKVWTQFRFKAWSDSCRADCEL